MLSIITDPTHPSLHQICLPTQSLDMAVLKEMFGLMLMHSGAGLAAPQVGISKRFFVTYWGEVFVNTRYDQISYPKAKAINSVEGCLSIPGKKFQVARYDRLQLGTKIYEGNQAIVIQHELDHLDGILISKCGMEVDA